MNVRLHDHQAREVQNHGLASHRALLWCPRSGKTIAALASAFKQAESGAIRRVLVTTPPGVVDHWVEEARRLGASAWRWDSNRRDAPMMSELHDVLGEPWLTVFVIGSQVWSLGRAQPALAAIARAPGGAMLIADESHDYASPSSIRGRRARLWARKFAASTRILTGTPLHNRLTDAWGQFEILSPSALGYRTFGQFCQRYAEYEQRHGPHGAFPKLVGYRRVDELWSRIRAWSSVVTADDIADMPSTRRRLVRTGLTEQTQAAYRDLRIGIDADNAAVRLQKMQQLVSADPLRIAATVARVKRADSMAVVWVRHNADVDRLSRAMRDVGLRAHRYTGSSSSSYRVKVHHQFRNGGAGGVLIAQPQACGVGIDFSSVRSMVWHAPAVDARTSAQATERCTRQGGGTVSVDHMASAGIDLVNLERVLRNAAIADATTVEDMHAVNEYGEVDLRKMRVLPAALRAAL